MVSSHRDLRLRFFPFGNTHLIHLEDIFRLGSEPGGQIFFDVEGIAFVGIRQVFVVGVF